MDADKENLRRVDRPTEDRILRISRLDVHDNGRIRIPARHRDHADVDADDVIDVRFLKDDISFWAFDLVVDSKGRIRIPSRKREIYGVGDGDTLDIEVMPTGMSVGSGEE